MNQHDIIVEPKYQVALCKDILRDFSKKNVIEPQVLFPKRDIIARIENIDERQDDSIDELRKIFDKELEKIMVLDDIAVNFAISEKLEQIWKYQASKFLKTIKEDYINRNKMEQTLMNLFNLIFLIIKRQNQIGQSCNYFLYLWKQTIDSPSIFDVFVYCDDWELTYRIIQILQDMKFDEQRKYSIKQSIVQHSFEEQIYMGFYLFTNIVIAMTSQNHFHHKNRYISLVEYQYNQVTLFKKSDSSSYLVTNISNLKEEEGDIVFRFDVSTPSKQQRNLCLWESFIQTIGKQNYLDCNTSQKQLELFEAFIEYKYATLCKENFTQAAYFQIFYRRLASFASSNKLSTLKNFCLQYMKKEIHFNYVSRQSIQNFSLNLIRDLLNKMDEKGWILKRKDVVSEQELIELKNDQLFRLAWDIVLFENANVLHFLQEQYKIENDLFGKIEDFIFQYYLNTKKNAYIYWESDMQFPNGANVDTSSGFFQLFFQQFKTNYEKVIFTNDSCPKKQKMSEYDNSIQNWQIKIIANLINDPESFNGKQGILSSIQFHELIRRYNETFRLNITEKFKEIFTLILDKCIDKNESSKLNDIFIHRMILICCQQLTDQKRMEIFQQKGIDYIEKLFISILKEKNTISAFTLLMLLEQGSEAFKNLFIEFIISSEKEPSFQIIDGQIISFSDQQYEHLQIQSNQDESKKVNQENNLQTQKESEINQESQNKQKELNTIQTLNDNKKIEYQKIRKQQIINVAESLFKDYGFCYDIFMNLSKTDAFNLSSKSDLEKNQELYALYVKYYAQVYLNKGTIMMHSQFFNQPGVKLQLRSQMLKTGVIESLIQKLQEDHEAEIEYYIKNIKNSQRICRVAYKMMINAKYTFLIHNLKQYIDTTMILCNSNASSDEKKEIKQEIIKHSFLVFRLILSMNSIFTYSLSNPLTYLSNIRITMLRYVEIITQNGSDDIDFNLLFCSIFSGLDANEKQTSQVLSATFIDINNAKEFNQQYLKFNKENILKLFDNFKLISKFYYNPDEAILSLQNIEEVNQLKNAKQIETISFIIKKVIKSLNDSNKKALIQKYFTKYHIKYVQNSFKIAALIQRKYVEELFKLKIEDVKFSDTLQSEQTILSEEQTQVLSNQQKLLFKQIDDEEVLKLMYKRIKCFNNITKFGLTLDVHGNSAEQMQVFVTFRDCIIECYNYVFFGTTSAPTIKSKSKSSRKAIEEIQSINKQNKQIINELNNSQNSLKAKINKKRKKQEDCRGLIKYIKNRSTTQSQKIVIHQFICMKYFTSLSKMFHYHIQAQQKVILKKEKPTIFIESNRFIKSITYLFKYSMDHIKECKHIFQKNQNQFQFTQIGGAGGGASSNISLSYLDIQTYSKKSCLSMSNFTQLLFQEFALFLTTRFPIQSNEYSASNQGDKKSNQNIQEEKMPLLSDHSKSAGSLDSQIIDRRYQNLDDVCLQDDTLSDDDIASSQISSSSSNQNVQFYDDDMTNQCDNDYGIGYIDLSESDDFSQQDIGVSCSLDYEIGEEDLEDESDFIFENDQNNEDNDEVEDISDEKIQIQNPPNMLKIKKQSSQRSQIPNLFQQTSNLSDQLSDQPSRLINQASNLSDLSSNRIFNQNKFQLKAGDSIIDDEQSEEYYIKSLENELQEIRLNQQTNENILLVQKAKGSLFNTQDNNVAKIQTNLENGKIQILKDDLQIYKKQSEIKNKQLKKNQKYEIYFAKLKYLISIIMNNLQQIEQCDVNQILQKITEKQIGAKIDRIKALQFFDTVFGSIESFDLGEAIPFKQFFNKFYYPALTDEIQQPISLSSKSKSANLEIEYHSKNISSQNKKQQEQDQQSEESKQDSNTQNINQNKSFEIDNIKQKLVKDLQQKKREIKFNKIFKQLQQKIKKNKLTFLDINLLNSHQQDSSIQNQNYVLKYIKEELLPYLNTIHQQIEQMNTQENTQQNDNNISQKQQSEDMKDQNKSNNNVNQSDQIDKNEQINQNSTYQQQNTSDQKPINELITERRKHTINIAVTLQVISYYLQFLTIKEGEKEKIEQIFSIMSQSIQIFSQCQEIIRNQSFFMNETLFYQQQSQKKISQIHQNLAQRYLNLSFQFILTSRQLSMKLFIDHNILSITSNINMASVDTFRNTISLTIFSIIYEIFNTPYIYYNTIEFSLKNYIFQQSKSDYQSFSFENKYSQPIDIQAYQNEAKTLIMKGPKDFMKAFQNIMGIEKLRKQKLKCFVKKKYKNKWCYPIKFDENQIKVFEQLYDVCKNSDTEKQIYEGMIKQQKTQAGSNNYLTDEIETECMNNFCFGKIMLNLLQYYPCLVGFGDINEKYHKLQLDFILQDSMGATKKLTKQYFTFYSLHSNKLDFIKDYWIKYCNQFDECIPIWENSTLGLQRLFQSLHMIDVLQEVSSHLKYEEALIYMKNFLEKIFVKIWQPEISKDNKTQNNQNYIQTNDMYYFQNYLNIPSIFAVFYKNYIKTYLYTAGFDEIFTQNTIYDYVKELKYCLQMTSMDNYQNTLNLIFKQSTPTNNPVSLSNILQTLDKQSQYDKNNQPSLAEINNQDITPQTYNQASLQTSVSQNVNLVNNAQLNNQAHIVENPNPRQQDFINALQIQNQQDQDKIEEINLVSQEFPFAQDSNIKSGQIDDELINEQLIAMQQDENECEDELIIDKNRIYQEEEETKKQNQLQIKEKQENKTIPQEIGKNIFKDTQKESNSDTQKQGTPKLKTIDLFESLKELQYGIKADGPIITTAYIFQQGIKFCGLVENKLCNQQSLSLFMGRDIPIIINDATQYLMTNTYYKTKWKNSYNQFPLNQSNLHTSLSKYLSKLSTENSKFSLLKEVNKVALHQYEKVLQKIQDKHDNQNEKQYIRNIQASRSKTSIVSFDQEKTNKSQKKIQISNESNNKNKDESPISKTLNKTGSKKRISQQKINSIEKNKDKNISREDLDQEQFLLESLNENDEQGILIHFINLQNSEIQNLDYTENKDQTSEEGQIQNNSVQISENIQNQNVGVINPNQIQELIKNKKQEIYNLLKPISNLKIRRKIQIILARHYYYDIQYVCQCIKEALANNSCFFVKNLFEFLAPINDDIYLQQEILSMQKVSEINVETIKTFISLFNPYFTGQNLLKTLPIKDDPTNHYKVSTTGKEYNFLQNRNPYTIDQKSKNKFDNQLANIIFEQKKKLKQLNDINKVKNKAKHNKKQQNNDSVNIMKQYLLPSDLQEGDLLLKEQTINIYLTSSNQKYTVKLKKKYFDLVFDTQFESSLIQFSHKCNISAFKYLFQNEILLQFFITFKINYYQLYFTLNFKIIIVFIYYYLFQKVIDIALAMQDQLSSEDDYISSLQNSLDQYEFLLIFIHNFENRRYLMDQLKRRMVCLNQNNSSKSHNEQFHDCQEPEIQNLYQFNEFQVRNFQKEELRTMLSNRYLMFLNILINNNEGIYELFLESENKSNQFSQKIQLIKQESINDNQFNLKFDNNYGSMVQNFIRDMGRNEYIIKSIQYQKSIKSNYKQFVTFYSMWFDRSFLYFKESYEPFLTQIASNQREKSMNQFILNEDFIKTYTTMLLNDLTSTNYKTKVNFHIEKIIIRLNKKIIYALIKEISFVLVEQIEPIVHRLLDSIKHIYKQMKSDSRDNALNLEKIDNNDRETYYNTFQQQTGKYVENLHSKCDKQFYLIKYMNNVFKIMLQQYLQRDQPLFYQEALQQYISKMKTETHEEQDNKDNTLNNIPSNSDLPTTPITNKINIIQETQNKNSVTAQLKDYISIPKIIINSNSPYIHSNHNINSSSSLFEGQNKLSSRQNLKEANQKQVLDFSEKQFNREKNYTTNTNLIIDDNNNQIKTDIYQEQIINSLKYYEECIKDHYEEILFDSGFFNLYSKILIFSKYYSISLQAGLIYNDRQSKYFSCYAYFSRSYQSLFYLYKIIHSNHHTQVQHILKGENQNGEVEENFEFLSQNSIDQNLSLIAQIQNSSAAITQNSQATNSQNPSSSAQLNIIPQEEQKQTEEQKKENEFSQFLQIIQNEQMQQTVSSVSLQEKEETSTPRQKHNQNKQSNQIDKSKQADQQIKKETQKYEYVNPDQRSSKILRTSHNLEDFDDEDLFGLNTMSTQELNLNCSLKYHELFKFFIRLENVIYFCIVRQPQDFAKIITQPLKDIQNRYSLYLKKMLIVSQTKFRVKKNINNNFTSSQSITIDRTKMIEESIPAVLTIKSEYLCLNTLYVKWKYESGIDEGGPRREWFSLLFNQLLDPNFGLFVQSKKNYTYMPNPFSFLVPDHLIYFKLLGILLGKAFLENYPVQANFAKPFLKLFLKKKIVISDLEEVDPELYKNLNWLLKNQVIAEDMDISFVYEKYFAGKKYDIELIEGGKNILVCDENKRDYVKSICHAKLIREIHYQAQAITSGFKEIVCEDLLQILDEQMLSFVFSGNPEISVTELQETIQLQGYTKNDKQIKWLFEILESFNNYEKSCFIFFITGSMNLPHGGFKQFPITITMTLKTERLPVAHTCANSIDLPNYPTKERLDDALRKALFECQGFELA